MKRKIVILALTAALQACSSAPSYVQLTEEKRNSIKNSKIYNFIPQDEVKPVVNLSSASLALGGGLIPALIDASVDDGRSTTARDLLKPLYDEIVDVDFRQLLAGEINPVLVRKISLGNADSGVDVEMLTDKELKTKISSLNANEAYMMMQTVYQFREDFKTLQTRSQVYLFLKPEGKVSLTRPDFYNVYTYQTPMVGDGGASSVSAWAKDNAQLFRNELKNSVAALVNMLDYDLSRPVVEECIGFAKAKIELDLNSQKFDGQIINRSGGNTLVRDKNGELVMMPSEQFTKNSKKQCQGA